MFKVLYAAGNHVNSKIQLSRFLESIEGEDYIVKIAAYKKSSPKNLRIDYTLDSLINPIYPNKSSLDNENFDLYYENIKKFNPDLIISDLDYFTSYVASILRKPIWQCSSSMINDSISKYDRYSLGLFSKHSYLYAKQRSKVNQKINMIETADRNFVYSHFCDMENRPPIKDKFEWVRPYHKVAKVSAPCKHNIVAILNDNNRNILSAVNRYKDSIGFSYFADEQFSNVKMKNIENDSEYFCNIRNSNLIMCEGQTSFLADAFYNKKFSTIIINFNDLECVTNAVYSEHFGLSKVIYDSEEELEDYFYAEMNSVKDENVTFLHEEMQKQFNV